MKLPHLPRILLIEDNDAAAFSLTQILRKEFAFDHVTTGKAGIYRADREHYKVIILDLGLPDIHGAHVCRQLRERDIKTPILVASADASRTRMIDLLDSGANGYITKPYSARYVGAKLRRLIRDFSPHIHVTQQYVFSEISLHTTTREVYRRGIPISLRRKEFALLEKLLMHAGTTVSREELIAHAWADNPRTPWKNTMDVHLKHLRDQIDRPFDSPMIKTVHGVGYRLITAAPAVKQPYVRDTDLRQIAE